MLRYRLDDLGWYQFEWLVQSLLKADIGLAVEAWGGRSDLGRDAFTASDLQFPLKDTVNQGPFVFQVKFVENANAAGARPDAAISDSVRRECGRIVGRRGVIDDVPPNHYSLLTNAPLSAALRADISAEIASVLPNAQIHTFGGNDICARLDLHPHLRRSFPQLLSLRDLDTLLGEVVNKNLSLTAVVIRRIKVLLFLQRANS